ncbi:MAG: sulfur carrier protein ThiS [Phycisphaerae bacterium]
MQIVINGESRDVPDGVTMSQLLEQMDLEPRRVAVERNRQLLPRKQFDQAVLEAGDQLEIVTLVGGG